MSKVFLVVPYEKKEEAKSLKCFYDMDCKQWYCKSNNEKALSMFSKRYLEIAYAEREEAKAKGAKWCATNKQWYTHNSNELI
jgi:hypothetical protein